MLSKLRFYGSSTLSTPPTLDPIWVRKVIKLFNLHSIYIDGVYTALSLSFRTYRSRCSLTRVHIIIFTWHELITSEEVSQGLLRVMEKLFCTDRVAMTTLATRRGSSPFSFLFLSYFLSSSSLFLLKNGRGGSGGASWQKQR
jgi:hypothetical protein